MDNSVKCTRISSKKMKGSRLLLGVLFFNILLYTGCISNNITTNCSSIFSTSDLKEVEYVRSTMGIDTINISSVQDFIFYSSKLIDNMRIDSDLCPKFSKCRYQEITLLLNKLSDKDIARSLFNFRIELMKYNLKQTTHESQEPNDYLYQQLEIILNNNKLNYCESTFIGIFIVEFIQINYCKPPK